MPKLLLSLKERGQDARWFLTQKICIFHHTLFRVVIVNSFLLIKNTIRREEKSTKKEDKASSQRDPKEATKIYVT